MLQHLHTPPPAQPPPPHTRTNTHTHTYTEQNTHTHTNTHTYTHNCVNIYIQYIINKACMFWNSQYFHGFFINLSPDFLVTHLIAFSLINSSQIFMILPLFIYTAYYDSPAKTFWKSHAKFHHDFHNLFMLPFSSSVSTLVFHLHAVAFLFFYLLDVKYFYFQPTVLRCT